MVCVQSVWHAGLGGGTWLRVAFAWKPCTDKKESQIFLVYKEIQGGTVAKSYMRKGFLIYEEMRKYLPIYEEAVSYI
jgi:hypothetical protein